MGTFSERQIFLGRASVKLFPRLEIFRVFVNSFRCFSFTYERRPGSMSRYTLSISSMKKYFSLFILSFMSFSGHIFAAPQDYDTTFLTIDQDESAIASSANNTVQAILRTPDNKYIL